MKDRIPAEAPAASTLLTGVARVEVANGPAGTAPRYTLHDGDDPSPANEYEICFRCHSSYAKLGPGQPDLALLTNPANASFHPIQAAGRNAINPQAFAGQMSAGSIIACSDCHDSLHGSVSGERSDLCFACHAFDVYGNASAGSDIQRASRFNAPSTSGHAFHVAMQQIACNACHETHGSARHAALIATGRLPGITSYTQSATGGTCTSTCHGAKTYAGNYAR
jgi:predicted CXXCH cytochrome family protein